ncbi:hypothetical protein TL16_g01133 [Triparma laevis f. inornata]|uniref:Uncharacterized protein n=2 Tax=Triparma laevis TaxID=1534972 RepID=A0A9W7FC93_9STRA|nr:hypothetical protein TL16_g01133 [Triparma laevis f. inornata]GMI09509.1 hypothetical protein TrLO_g1284 [Triparma laevis f. longispina]
MSSSTSSSHVVTDQFAYRQFPESHADTSSSYGGSKMTTTCSAFEEVCNSYIDANGGLDCLKEGYAPFCKHIFIPVTTPSGLTLCSASVNYVEVNLSNESLLLTSYEARNDKELPVLTRYFPPNSIPPTSLPSATHLDVILYSRSQILKENIDTSTPSNPNHANTPWSIVSVKPQTVDYELPMNPITAMRNALGTEYGGSGKPIDREEYMKAVEFWKKYAIVK